MWVLISTLVRNNEKWLPQFYSMVDIIKRNNPDIHFGIHIYENDSTDSTKSLLKYNYTSNDFGHPQDMMTRTTRLAFYRNDAKRHITDLDLYDYILMVDANMLFGAKAFNKLLETLTDNSDIAMATPHAMVHGSIPCEFYYDTFAMGLGQFDSVFECSYQGARHDRHCHKVAHSWPQILASGPRLTEVEKCFGGFVLIRKDAYKNSEWRVKNPQDCEHWEFCADVLKHGKIVIDRESKVLWYE